VGENFGVSIAATAGADISVAFMILSLLPGRGSLAIIRNPRLHLISAYFAGKKCQEN
jgi:hypothetical protein